MDGAPPTRKKSVMAANVKEDSTEKKNAFPIYQILATVGVSLCSAITGFTGGFSAPATDSLRQPESKIHVTEEDISWIGSLSPFFSIFGALIAGLFMNYLGRKSTLMGSCPAFVLAYLLISFATNVGMICAGRALSGFFVGLVSAVFPIYLGETLDATVRGRLGIMPTVLGNGGMVIAYAVGAGLDWSMLALFGAFFSIPYLIIMFFVPETPRWYVSKAKMEKATRSAQKLRGQDADVSKELENLLSVDEEDKKNAWEMISQLFKKRNLIPLSICCGLMFFQQLCGINAFMYYMVEIFKESGSSVNANMCSIIVGFVNFCATMMAIFLIDKFGRKILLYGSFSLMTLTLIVFGGYSYAKETKSDVSSLGWLPLVCLVLYVIGFSSGAGPVPWLMMGELLPVKIRNVGASVVSTINMALSFVITKTYHSLVSVVMPYGALWMYAVVSLVGIAFIFFAVPETRGKTLEDIQRRFMSLDEGAKVKQQGGPTKLPPQANKI